MIAKISQVLAATDLSALGGAAIALAYGGCSAASWCACCT